MPPAPLGWYSTPVFGAVAFCTTNIEDFRTPFDVNLFDNIIDLYIAEEVIEVDLVEEKNNGGH